MEKFQKVKELISSIEKDAVAFYHKGNKAAGTRLRNVLQQVKASATQIRKEVTEIKKKAK